MYTAVYQTEYHALHPSNGHTLSKDNQGNPIMLYGGDADLLLTQNGKKDYGFQALDEPAGDDWDGIELITHSYCGVNQQTGEIDTDADYKTDLKYTADANYIIFRDIDLSSANWNPLMFSGTMVGAKANDPADQSTLWTNPSQDNFSNATGFAEGVQRPQIQNVTVIQNDAIDPEKTKGVGFFATLSRPGEISNNSIGSSGQVLVKNLELVNVHIENNTDQLDVDVSLLGGLWQAWHWW